MPALTAVAVAAVSVSVAAAIHVSLADVATVAAVAAVAVHWFRQRRYMCVLVYSHEFDVLTNVLDLLQSIKIHNTC